MRWPCHSISFRVEQVGFVWVAHQSVQGSSRPLDYSLNAFYLMGLLTCNFHLLRAVKVLFLIQETNRFYFSLDPSFQALNHLLHIINCWGRIKGVDLLMSIAKD